jgi:ABC-type antimicrobial peptide transport system permease subunit
VYPYLVSYEAQLKSRTFLAQVFVTMGAFALILAAVGIYGVLAYAVSQRLREFAVRLALGARREDMLRLVLHDGLVMTLAGTGLGAFFALWSSYSLESFLEDVYPTDALTLVSVEAVLVAVAVGACLAPALRAMRADPIGILRAT